MIVYAVENTVNSKLYIGATTRDLETRFNQHVRAAKRGSDFAFHCAIRKHGEDAFQPAILKRASSEKEMYELEAEYVDLFDTYNGPGYNMTEGGGSGPSNCGEDNWRCKLSEEDVLEIRTRYASNEGVTLKKLAREFGVIEGTIGKIVNGVNWPDVGGPITKTHTFLTEKEVIEIRKKYATGNVPQAGLAEEYNVSSNTISAIVRGKRFPDAGGPIAEKQSLEHCNNSLTEKEVIEIRKKYANGGVSYNDLANEYDIALSQIGRIVKGEQWPDAGGPIKGEDYS